MAAKRWPFLVALFPVLALAAAAAAVQPPAARTGAPSPLANPGLAPLAGFLGNWEIDGKWLDGNPIWARNEFTVGLAAQFVSARTFARNESGEVYQRYFTYFTSDPGSGTLSSHGFTYDGTSGVIEAYEIEGEAGRESLTSHWTAGSQEVRQTLRLTSHNAYSWKVWVRPAGDGEWKMIMDGVWHRVD